MDRIFQQFLRVHKVTTDTRHIEKDSIFFALKGERFNGNTFALQALEAGASMAVVDEVIAGADERVVQVNDVLAALQELSKMYRSTFSIPFVAITGSNGKTTTKELMRDVLKKKYKVHATKGNLNNHIGVPLTLLSMPADTELAIIEMGANHQKEISSYCQYAMPDFGLITNIGKAHLEGFGGEEGVKKGKRELYDFIQAKEGLVFANTEYPVLDEVSKGMRRVEYGFHTGGQHLSAVEGGDTLTFDLSTENNSAIRVHTQLAGSYNLYNMASAIAVGRYFGVPLQDIVDAIEAYTPDNNRSQLVRSAKNTIIMDAYNANPNSMVEALKNLAKQNHTSKLAIIGDMRELGETGPLEHQKIIDLAQELGLSCWLVGPIFFSLKEKSNFPAFLNTDDAKQYLQNHPVEKALVLLKGSRGIKLEGLSDLL